jgi:hypothetical protein
MEKRIRITVDTWSVLIVRRRRGFFRAWCEGCARLADFIPLEEACALAGRDAANARLLLEAGKLHALAPDGEATLICVRSVVGAARG